MKIDVTPVMIEAACQVRYKKWAAHNDKPAARASMRAILEAALSTPIQFSGGSNHRDGYCDNPGRGY